MDRGNKTKTCQNCEEDFTIEPEDFAFYEKIDVPPPTFCSECRFQRRAAFFNLTDLHKRTCDLCQTDMITMYHPDAPYTVYCPKCWWSDKWDAREYARKYDFDRPFFEQFKELWKEVPMLGLSINTKSLETSPYCNHVGPLDHCYLMFNANYSEHCQYGFMVTESRDCFDCSVVGDMDRCYDCNKAESCYGCIGLRSNVQNCMDCYFLRDCNNCQDCFASCNLYNKQYCFFNEQLTKEEYFKRIAEYDLGSYSDYQRAKKEAEEFWYTQPPKPLHIEQAPGSSGNYIFWSKNCKQCFDVTGAEDAKYCQMVYNEGLKDSYDVLGWGDTQELCYENTMIGSNTYRALFANEAGLLHSAEYVKLCIGDSNLFGCIGIKKGTNMIFNKQYTEEEYIDLREKIIEQTKEMPYVDTKRREYRYGEFFPTELSPFAYETALAQTYFPLNKTTIQNEGYTTYTEQERSYDVTIQASELSDHISDVNDGIINEIIACRQTGQAYRITKPELNFLKEMNLPLPRTAPLVRINEQIKEWSKGYTLVERKSSVSGEKFMTHYTKEEAPYVLSPEEYKREFLG